ncbi:Uncharacterized protein TCM_023654 [Theobroma cacao]|uniref:Uncharacterized protein n=1 Tax=Theobroma cacao TaxID=3641 RepID=A0A061EUE5_THECC|nr:Uncharacterized protein TCM_023654 [Theobroma cacao]
MIICCKMIFFYAAKMKTYLAKLLKKNLLLRIEFLAVRFSFERKHANYKKTSYKPIDLRKPAMKNYYKIDQ